MWQHLHCIDDKLVQHVAAEVLAQSDEVMQLVLLDPPRCHRCVLEVVGASAVVTAATSHRHIARAIAAKQHYYHYYYHSYYPTTNTTTSSQN